jgi:hypothetical protein
VRLFRTDVGNRCAAGRFGTRSLRRPLLGSLAVKKKMARHCCRAILVVVFAGATCRPRPVAAPPEYLVSAPGTGQQSPNGVACTDAPEFGFLRPPLGLCAEGSEVGGVDAIFCRSSFCPKEKCLSSPVRHATYVRPFRSGQRGDAVRASWYPPFDTWRGGYERLGGRQKRGRHTSPDP